MCDKPMTFDLKQAEGRAAFDRLLATADVMVVNFPLKVRERLRMRYEDVRAVNPRLIYASISGYGQTGPYSSRAGYDPCIQAEVGLMDATGPEDGEMCRVGTAAIDYATGADVASLGVVGGGTEATTAPMPKPNSKRKAT